MLTQGHEIYARKFVCKPTHSPSFLFLAFLGAEIAKGRICLKECILLQFTGQQACDKARYFNSNQAFITVPNCRGDLRLSKQAQHAEKEVKHVKYA